MDKISVLYKIFAELDSSLPKSDRLEQAILTMIQTGQLQTGDPLPPQRTIAQELDIALGIVTKSINKLKKNGILYGERGRGSFLAFKTPFAHDFGDRFLLDEAWLDEKAEQKGVESPILCNLVERLSFLNDPLPKVINLINGGEFSSLKEYGAQYLRQYGLFLHPEDVSLSHNAYIAFWVAFQLCCTTGTVLGAPALSFIPIFRNKLMANGVQLIPLPCDQYGIIPDALENACKTHKLNVLTCSPECELPTTNRMGQDRRIKIATIARQYDLTIIEHSWLLPTEKEPDLPALTTYAPERSIFLEHGSKMLSCENFCSFSYIPVQLQEKFNYLRNIIAGPIPLMSRKISQFWLESGLVEHDFKKKNKEIVIRNDMAKKCLYPLPLKTYQYARFCWLPLAKDQSGTELRERLQKRGVLISTAQNYLIGSACEEDGILIGLGYEPSREKLEMAFNIIKEELL